MRPFTLLKCLVLESILEGVQKGAGNCTNFQYKTQLTPIVWVQAKAGKKINFNMCRPIILFYEVVLILLPFNVKHHGWHVNMIFYAHFKDLLTYLNILPFFYNEARLFELILFTIYLFIKTIIF